MLRFDSVQVHRASLLIPPVLVLLACTDSTAPKTRPPNDAIKVWIRQTGLVLSQGATFQTGAVVYDDRTRSLFEFPGSLGNPWPQDLEIEWTSTVPGVVQVTNGGLVTAVKEGGATIWVDVEGQRDSGAVIVRRLAPSTTTYSTVAAGAWSTCAIDGERRVWCWGSDWHGALGRGNPRTFTSAATPGLVIGGYRFESIELGGSTACGITDSGQTYCWGENTTGKLGNGTDSLIAPYVSGVADPTPVARDPGFDQLSVAAWHACGLAGVKLYCWGSNVWGETGSGTSGLEHVTEPTTVVGDLEFTAVSTGGLHTCAISTDGRGFCWGSNLRGQLGSDATEQCVLLGTPVPCSTVPLEISGDLTFRAIAAGALFTCGLTAEQRTYCWGLNTRGEAGQGTGDVFTSPVAVADAPLFERLVAGASHACGLTSLGEAYCWGQNRDGQLGNGEQTGFDRNPTPQAVSGGLHFTTLTAANDHTCGLTAEGATYCWGWNKFGQVGDGTVQSADAAFRHVRLLPVRVVDP